MTGSGAELIRQMVAGDREAFARFYDRYAPLVFPLIQRILRERADASDVLQEVFWEAWQGAAGYDRSEEHTSELQSQSNLVCRLLLEKKKRYCIPSHGALLGRCSRRISEDGDTW